MAELRWIQMFLLMILMLHFSVTLRLSYITFRDGDDVTLSCQNEINDHDKCSLTYWFFRHSEEAPVIDLVKSGQIDQTLSRSRSDRLNVTEKCSLAIKNVRHEDVGRYVCRQRDRDSDFDLSVVTLTEQNMDQRVILTCFVPGPGKCEHTVKWLFMSKEVDRDRSDFQTSQSSCFANVSIRQFHYIYPSRFTAFQCEVTGPDRNKQKFSFRSQSSRPDDKTTVTIQSTTPASDTTFDDNGWWRIIIVSVALTTLIVIVVVLNVWTRTKGNKTMTDENTLHDEDDDEGAVNYENVGVSSASV